MTKAKRHVDPQRAENLAKALAGLDDKTYRNPNEAAKATGAEVSTIYRRLRGQKSRRDANVDSQALTPTEEYSLVQWLSVQRQWAILSVISFYVNWLKNSEKNASNSRESSSFLWGRNGYIGS